MVCRALLLLLARLCIHVKNASLGYKAITCPAPARAVTLANATFQLWQHMRQAASFALPEASSGPCATGAIGALWYVGALAMKFLHAFASGVFS